MQVIVRDRQKGKTTELIKWLLQGKEQDTYPYWSRVIVCPFSNVEVTRVTNEVFRYIEAENWNPCEQMLPHMHPDGVPLKEVHLGVLTDVRKAVWSLADYLANEVGTRTFEFAIDNIEYIWERGYRILREPAIITMTGKLYDGLRD